MFEPAATPRLFALPPGVDFAAAFVDGLRARLAHAPPEAMARVTVFTNTRRSARRMTELLIRRGPGFLPRILPLADLGDDPLLAPELPPAVSALRRRLELTRAVDALLKAEPGLAPRSAAYALACALARLMDEMNEEGVPFSALAAIDPERHQEHWQISLRFLSLLEPYMTAAHPPDPPARRHALILRLIEGWRTDPPADPVIVAGSTGSRATTARLMRAVARLPQGAVVLPGLDPALPAAVAGHLADPVTPPDHAQSALMRLLASLDTTPEQVAPWHDVPPPDPPRLRLISLAMRPAPVTDQWLTEGPALGDPAPATRALTLVEAATPREEALAVALALRRAVEDGRSAALVTPDRDLARRVTAQLARWNIRPDDSAGRPLSLTPPGVFLRLVATLLTEAPSADRLMALLKHPLTHSGAGRRAHLERSRALELALMRPGPAVVDPAPILRWAETRAASDPAAPRWARWLADALAACTAADPAREWPLADHLARLRRLAESLAAGPEAPVADSGLWTHAAGKEAARRIALLEEAADAAGPMPGSAFAALLHGVLSEAELREGGAADTRVMIRGTLEARTLSADLVVMGGLNEGVWPATPAPDPWLSRQMRLQAGLLPPERRIGLAALDFFQAIQAPEVVLSRALRDAEAPTVASRWLIRLTNLLAGLGPQGQAALEGMRARGRRLTGLARRLDRPAAAVPAAPRPAPAPPVALRPARLSVTRITTLVRDPYAIYAREVLRLRPLDPLRPRPDDPRLRGEVLHRVMERFVAETATGLPDDAETLLLRIAEQELARNVPWSATRGLWLSRLSAAASRLIADERRRRADSTPLALEVPGRLELADPPFDPPFLLTAKADRIDRMDDGRLAIYDYKSGMPPSLKQVRHFDRQLPLEAAMAEQGAFDGVPAARVGRMEYVGLRGSRREVPVDEYPAETTLAQLKTLLAAWHDPARGYVARARMATTDAPSDYDHLSRYGEWDHGDPAHVQPVGGGRP